MPQSDKVQITVRVETRTPEEVRAADLPEGSVILWGNRRVRRAGDDALWRTADDHGTYTDAEIDILLRSGKAQVLRVGKGQEG